MTYKEKITILDNTIATLNSELSIHYTDGRRARSRGDALKKMAMLALTDLESSNVVKDAIDNVSFCSLHCSDFSVCIGSFNDQINGIETTFQQGVRSLIDILLQERERLQKAQQDREQKSIKNMNKWTLIFSAIAALGTIATLLFTIFN